MLALKIRLLPCELMDVRGNRKTFSRLIIRDSLSIYALVWNKGDLEKTCSGFGQGEVCSDASRNMYYGVL